MNLNDSKKDIQHILLEWFSDNGRNWIPWKLNRDGFPPAVGECISPYQIWIAEVMLQQTQLKVVIPYWEKWMKTFPDLCELEEADEQEVLLQWQGLGYYSRAKRLHQSSKLLIKLIGKEKSQYSSSWPIEIDQWISLPGIGRSTAGSIISSAFDLPTPILDGNVKRILTRLIASNRTYRQNTEKLWAFSTVLIHSVDSPRNFNQALMDLGAMVCTNQKPKCSICPLQNCCLAYIKYDPVDFPKKSMKKIIPIQQIGIGLVFNKERKLLIDQRLESSSMGGMWEFPGGKKEPQESIEQTIEREIREEIGIDIIIGEKLLSFEHMYSHKKLHFIVHLCEWKSGKPKPLASQKLCWVSPDRLYDYPFPAANTRIINELHKFLRFEDK
tara:strand:- start:3340 stop:4491 length:1152 start_codon:yes stop_codon:yes gene_type:complete